MTDPFIVLGVICITFVAGLVCGVAVAVARERERVERYAKQREKEMRG